MAWFVKDLIINETNKSTFFWPFAKQYNVTNPGYCMLNGFFQRKVCHLWGECASYFTWIFVFANTVYVFNAASRLVNIYKSKSYLQQSYKEGNRNLFEILLRWFTFMCLHSGFAYWHWFCLFKWPSSAELLRSLIRLS